MYKLNPKIIVTLITILILFAGVLLLNKLISKKLKPNANPAKGTLIMNTDKYNYSPGEEVYIQIVSLDSNGNILCNSNLLLEINKPDNTIISFSTAEKTISLSPTCNPNNNATNNPDYSVFFKPESDGIYKIKLINKDDGNSQEISIQVNKEKNDFSVSRWSATRINPFKAERYPMKITVLTQKDFKGRVVEQIPASFEIVWQGPAKVEKENDNQYLTWELDLKAGETKELIYEYKAPQKGLEFFTLGEVKLVTDEKTIFEDNHSWQIVTNKISN